MSRIPVDKVHDVMKEYTIGDGQDLIYDYEKSHGSYFYDAMRDEEYLDLFTFYATLPIGHNHPKLREDDFLDRLASVAVNKPSSTDIYTQEIAEFTKKFAETAAPGWAEHFFFISGGTLAVENALKTAMDWKIKKNFKRGKEEELGHQVIHFEDSFHGRSGYTLSLTNTFDPRKYKYFTRFDWPRVEAPALRFPVTEEVKKDVKKQEQRSIEQINEAIEERGEDIASLIIEPIQGEGGDKHFRSEFFQKLRKICDENEIMFVLDEIQAGMGLTGEWWAYQNYDFEPDMIAYGKKSQVCGIMSNERVEEVEDHCFEESSRLNSTWGGNLVDMFRATKYLEIIEEENLVQNAEEVGNYLQDALLDLQEDLNAVSNVRGEGLMCAFDLPTTDIRDDVKEEAFERNLLILKSGERSIRFRPPLDLNEEEVDEGISILEKSIKSS
ncbi:MAG: L-lysine 6-transaminase [Candidatus Thermoplasmatota archaeon]|nr:L-lysine 6-transaminase [Candidatus Thermoplasmatota archaeon]